MTTSTDSAASPINSPHILVIDADRDLRRLYATLLTRAGYQVTTLPYEKQSVAAVTAVAPDVMLADFLWHDPVAGRHFIHRVRVSFPELPIVVCSATLPRALTGADMGALRLAFVTKPFTGEQLLTAIARQLSPARTSPADLVLG